MKYLLHTLTFRITFFNFLGFLIPILAVSYFLDQFQRNYLFGRIDRNLETEVLVITAELDQLEENDTDNYQFILEQFSQGHGIGRYFFRVLDSQSKELAASDLSHWPGIRDHPLPMTEVGKTPITWETVPLREHGVRIIYYQSPEGRILQIGQDLDDVVALLSDSRLIFGSGMLLILIAGIIFGWLSTIKALSGIRRVSHAAALIREHGDLAHRVPSPTGSAETDQLAAAFNSMLARIKDLIKNLRYVMDNIAHDIKTPVTRMRGIAEAELRSPGDKDLDYLELCGHVVEECDHILSLVNTLLEITATEAGLVQWKIARVDLTDLVREGCDLFTPVVENKNLTLKVHANQNLTIETDGRALQRVVSNMLDNAIKYTPEGGSVDVSLTVENNAAHLVFKDSGIGVNPGELELIFNRFHRSDRSRTEPGSGLGLSFCKATVEALGGEITVKSIPNQGSSFTVIMPLTFNTASKKPVGLI